MHVNKFLQHFVMHNLNIHPPFLLLFFFPKSCVFEREKYILTHLQLWQLQCHSARETGYGAVGFHFGGCNPLEAVSSLSGVIDTSMFPSLFISEVLHLSSSLDVSLEFRHLVQMRIPTRNQELFETASQSHFSLSIGLNLFCNEDTKINSDVSYLSPLVSVYLKTVIKQKDILFFIGMETRLAYSDTDSVLEKVWFCCCFVQNQNIQRSLPLFISVKSISLVIPFFHESHLVTSFSCSILNSAFKPGSTNLCALMPLSRYFCSPQSLSCFWRTSPVLCALSRLQTMVLACAGSSSRAQASELPAGTFAVCPSDSSPVSVWIRCQSGAKPL